VFTVRHFISLDFRSPRQRQVNEGKQLEQLIDFYVKSTIPKCPTTHLADKHPARCTLTKPIVSTIPSGPLGVRLAGRGWRQTEVNPVTLVLYRPSNP
jgi:hypothetical protein